MGFSLNDKIGIICGIIILGIIMFYPLPETAPYHISIIGGTSYHVGPTVSNPICNIQLMPVTDSNTGNIEFFIKIGGCQI